ncbi:MAG: AroM family protein [Clostridiales bacterium]|nr:AroM family protein [Clostridiales bacterium]
MKEKILAAITIGQAPRVDITADILPLLPQHVTLREYGALDDFTLEEIEARFAPAEGDEVLVSRMRDGRQAQFAERFVTPLVQQKIDQAEAEGADATILFCTGVFPKFRHKKLFLEPQPLFHAAVQKLADGHKVGVLVPMEEQIAQGYQFWGKSGVDVEIACASPYGAFDRVVEAAKAFKGRELAFLCTDCMGYSVAMKRAIEDETGLSVLLPRTLAVRILCEFLA